MNQRAIAGLVASALIVVCLQTAPLRAEATATAASPVQCAIRPGEPEVFCPVYLSLFSRDTIEPAASFAVDHGSSTILASEQRVDGTGDYVQEAYFLVSGDSVELMDLRTPLDRALGETLLKGCSLRAGGGIDVKTLTFEHPIWCEEGGYTGEVVKFEFELGDGELTLRRQRYATPEYDAERK